MINVAIVESDKELNSILFSRLKTADINLVEQFYTARDFLNALPQLKSQIVLIDIILPCIDLVAFISTIKKQKPEIKIIVMSAWVQHDLIYKTICAGASGYVNKFGDKNYFINTISEMAHGRAQLSIPIARLIQTRFSAINFTDEQSQIIKLISSGFSYNHVADALKQSREAIIEKVGGIYNSVHKQYGTRDVL